MKKKFDSKLFKKFIKDDASDYIKQKIDNYNIWFSYLNKTEEELVYIKIINTLLDPYLVYSGKHRKIQWNDGWNENYIKFNKQNDLRAVSPMYFGKYNVNRLGQRFVKALSPEYERKMLYIILDYLFDKYLREKKDIYEFGCGTGHNLLRVREINPFGNLYGLDWAKSSQKIIEKMSTSGLVKNITGFNFDFFKPNKKIKLKKDSAIYTVAALEQVGSDYKPFVAYILKNKPSICIHVEPIAELLDENRLIDNLSIKYFKKRNYLCGYLNYLRELESNGKIKILKSQRSYIGSMYIEGYSIIVWLPK